MNENRLKRFFPNASTAFIKKNSDLPTGNQRLPSNEQQQPKRGSLDSPTKRKEQSTARFEITFEIYAVRPNDWDNVHVKEIQDSLIRAGILFDDNYKLLQGRIIAKKAHSKEEERTVITLEKIE